MDVIISEKANRHLISVLKYLKKRWDNKTAEKFLTQFDETIQIVLNTPTIGEASEYQPGLRRILITKHNAMFYLFINDVLHVVAILDTRTKSYKR
jgi:plasmid stabilization system protein ParE